MYDLIEQKRSVRKLYTEALIGRGDITIEEAEQAMQDFQHRLERVFAEVREAKSQPDTPAPYVTVPVYPDKPEGPDATATTPEVLKKIADAHTTLPEGFTVHPKVLPQLQRRAHAITQGPIDWASAEITAFGSLLLDGRPVRLAGQDSRRGTFVQRFAALIDRVNGAGLHPAAAPRREPGELLRLRLAAQRVRRARLRVRLLRGPAGGADAVGGAVRRLRQRRAVDHRRVHLVR